MNRLRTVIFLLAVLCLATGSLAQSKADTDPSARGLRATSAASAEGFILFTPLISNTVYLINTDGEVVHTWTLDRPTSQEVFLLEDGSLVYQTTADSPILEELAQVGGIAGRVQKISADLNPVWSFEYAGDSFQQHHDIEVLPNGNILLIAWEIISAEEALANGMRSEVLPENGTVWPDQIVEIEPISGEIAWMWRVWDHLVQDTDPALPNYGVVAEHPERIDVNYVGLRRLGDWQHSNAIDYNPVLDQIMLSVRHFSEIWVIDHSTTTEEARTSSGGLLYRWGNPEAYQAGTAEDRALFAQHDAHWIEPGLPGEGNILIFNNGDELAGRLFSDMLEIAPLVSGSGRYSRAETGYSPAEIPWEYQASPAEALFAPYVSSLQRLPNGNTFVVNGTGGQMLEVTPDGEVVWEFLNPFKGNMPDETPFSPYSVFRARYYAPDYPGLAVLGLNAEQAP